MAWRRWEQPIVAARGVVPAAAMVPVCPSIVHIPALYAVMDHSCCSPGISITIFVWPVLYSSVILDAICPLTPELGLRAVVSTVLLLAGHVNRCAERSF